MEEILHNIEELIDNLERDSQITRDEVIKTLYSIKEEVREHNLSSEEDISFGYDSDY